MIFELGDAKDGVLRLGRARLALHRLLEIRKNAVRFLTPALLTNALITDDKMNIRKELGERQP